MTPGKTIALTRWTFVGKVMSLLFNMLSGLVITFLPRSKHLLISWLQSPSAVILEPPKIKSDTVSIVSPSICLEVKGPDAMILVFWMLSFKPTFSLSSFTFIKSLCSSSLLSAIRVVSSAYLRLLIFLPAILIPAFVSSSPAFLMMYSAFNLNNQHGIIQPWHTPFPIWNQSVVPHPVLTVASWPAYRFFRRQVRWSGIPISLRIFHSFCDPHSQRLWHGQKAEVDVFWNSLLDDPKDVSNLILVPMTFLNPAWTFGSSWFACCWSRAWRFWALFCSCVRWVQLCGSLSILWLCLSLGLEWKLTSSSPVATAEFSRFAGILSAALSQHHLLGFEIAQLEFHPSTSFVHNDAS